MDDTQEWIEAFIMLLREEIKKLSKDEKARISNLDDFSEPCQILLLGFGDVNIQYLICTHDDNKEDMEIDIKSPIPLYEAVDVMQSILGDPRWGRKLSEKELKHLYGVTTFSEILENSFLSIIREIRNVWLEKPPKTSSSDGKSMLTMKSFVWKIRGNISELNRLKMINEIIEHAKKESERAKTKIASSPRQKPVIKGCSTFFYPPIWVGKLPKKTFREKVFGSFTFPEKALDMEYKGKVLVMDQNGLIAIGEENFLKASKMFNEIMATFLLKGIETNAVREIEVGDATIDPSSKSLTGWGIRADTPRTQFLNPFSTEIHSRHPITEIDKQYLTKVIKQAERITADPEISDFLLFFLEADTYLKNSEYMQSFIMSWVVVERHAYWLWSKFLKEEGIPRRRRDKLMNPAFWTTDSILEGLNLLRQMSQKDYEELMVLKNKRNDIIHSGETVSKEEAEKCLNIAKNIVRERCNLR